MEQSYFEWIEETNEPEFDEIRRRIESLWLRTPRGQRAEYEARLRSKRSTDFFSAYNELWYQHALEVGGIRCSLAEPTHAGSLPDWQLGGDHEPVAVAECYLRMQPVQARRNDDVQNRWFGKTFKKLRNKSIRLSIHERTCGVGQPSAQRLAKELDALAESSPVEQDLGTSRRLGRHRYDDPESGWHLDFTLILRTSQAPETFPQLLYTQCDGASWCQGEDLLEEALSRKSRQHSGALPVIICVGWNYFEHEPDFDNVCDVVAKKSSSFDTRGVCGVFWAREVYPWKATVPAPHLLHWGSSQSSRVVALWTGAATDVSTQLNV